MIATHGTSGTSRRIIRVDESVACFPANDSSISRTASDRIAAVSRVATTLRRVFARDSPAGAFDSISRIFRVCQSRCRIGIGKRKPVSHKEGCQRERSERESFPARRLVPRGNRLMSRLTIIPRPESITLEDLLIPCQNTSTDSCHFASTYPENVKSS